MRESMLRAALNPKSPTIIVSWPITPSSTMRLMVRGTGRYRVHIASIRNRLRCRATAMTSAASATLMAKGFSHRTGLPASRARMLWSRCRLCGVVT